MPYILALDQGTTSSRAILFDQSANIPPNGIAQQEFPQLFPHPGHVEHNPADIWQSQLTTAHQVLINANIPSSEINAIAITNQRETTLLWDRKTGQPLHNALVWQDRRTADFCSQLKSQGHEPLIQQKTGLVIDAYFSSSKLHWLLENIPNARARAHAGQLAFGTVDSWLLYNLTQKKVHATDPSNASRTMLFNIHTQDWDNDLLQLFNIPRTLLPEVHPSSHHFGETTLLGGGGGRAIPICSMIGDQQAALFGQACFSPGQAKNTYGTGCFLLMNTGTQPAISKNKLLSTIAWSLPQQSKIENQKSKITFALEGSIFIAGALIQWLRDGLGIIQNASEIEPLAASVPDSGGVYLVPAFAGLGAPHWDQYARGSIAGLTRATTKAHIARAALEAIAFQVADLLDIMQQDSHTKIETLHVDGGASKNNLLLQFQADLLQTKVLRPQTTESTAQGAAYLAGLATGFYKSLEQLQSHPRTEKTFTPQMSPTEVTARRARWTDALNRSRSWAQPADPLL